MLYNEGAEDTESQTSSSNHTDCTWAGRQYLHGAYSTWSTSWHRRMDHMLYNAGSQKELRTQNHKQEAATIQTVHGLEASSCMAHTAQQSTGWHMRFGQRL